LSFAPESRSEGKPWWWFKRGKVYKREVEASLVTLIRGYTYEIMKWEMV